MSPWLASLTFQKNSKWDFSERAPSIIFNYIFFSLQQCTLLRLVREVISSRRRKGKKRQLIIIYTSPLWNMFCFNVLKKYSDIRSNIHKLKYSALLVGGLKLLESSTTRYHARRASLLKITFHFKRVRQTALFTFNAN